MRRSNLIKQDAALTNTNASHYVAQVKKANTIDKLAELAIELQSLAMIHGRGLIEARFWLGAVVAKGQNDLHSGWGHGFFQTLAHNTGIGEQTLRKAMNFYDLFKGDPTEMYAWSSSYIEKHGSLLWSDVSALLSVNRVLVKKARELRTAKWRASRYKKPSRNLEWAQKELNEAKAEIEGVEIIEPDLENKGKEKKKVINVEEFCKQKDQEVPVWRLQRSRKFFGFGAGKQQLLNLYMSTNESHTIPIEHIKYEHCSVFRDTNDLLDNGVKFEISMSIRRIDTNETGS